MSQRSGAGSGRGGEGSQKGAGGSHRGHASGQPPSSASGSQRSVQGPPPFGTVEGLLYKHPEDPTSTLNHEVLRLENEYQNLPNLSSLSLTAQRFPVRPGYGQRGKQAIIWANYFQLLVDPRLVLYQYKIRVEPQAVGRKLTRIIELFLQQPQSVARSDSICSDFKSTLFSRVLLDDGFTACNIVYRSEFETVPGPRAAVYHLRLEHTKTLPVRSLLEFISTTNMSTVFEDKDALLQAFNVFLNHYAKCQGNLVTIGGKTFPKDTIGRDLGRGLTAIRGFFSSVRAATGRILVNVNVCCSAFYRPGQLVWLISAYGTQDMYRLEQLLRGVRVKLTHTGTPRIGTIKALASPSDGTESNQPRPIVPGFGAGPNQVQFWFQGQQRYVTVSEFFYRSYGIRLNNEKLPVVNVGSKAHPVYLPPQVCEIIAGQKAGIKLDADQTSKMISYAIRRPPPAQNALSIAQEGLPMVGMSWQTNPLLDHFHVKINPNFTSIPARILPRPRIMYGNKRSATVSPSAAWNLRGLAMSRPATIAAGKWGWLYITMPGYPPAFQSVAHVITALDSFRMSLRATGINIGEASPGSRQLHLKNEEDPELDKVLTSASERLDLIYIILPVKQTFLYNRVKRFCDIKVGLVNICSIGNKLVESNGRPQYFGNVALKFNLKGGGDNQLVDPSRLHFISRGDTMIVGIDVTHPDPNSSNIAPSVAAMVASINAHLGQWLATSSIQSRSRQEFVNGLKNMLKDLLNLWKTEGKHTMFPRNILVYRDGVSEGQYGMVKDHELPLLRQACEEVYDLVGQERPHITVVVVTKRHHTRFGPTTQDTSDSNGNCLPGVVTDRGITEAGQWDFWLQAHSAIQGAARSAHYFVVHDEIFRTNRPSPGYTVADTLEDVTQSLHYTFGRCTRAVSYCTPAYYADLVCERARRYLSSLFDPSSHSDTASIMSGLDQEDEDRWRTRLQELITPHPRVRNKMYYI